MTVMSEFRRSLAEYIRAEAKPRDKFGHQPRLYELTRLVGEGKLYDDDVVYAAAWLHDLGVFYGHRPSDPEQLARWDNTGYACQRAPDILRGMGFPEEKIPAVVEAIRTHQPSAIPQSLEAEILRDADILEQLGAIGILRATCKVGRDTRFETFSDIMPVLQNALAELPGKLHLERSRELAAKKIDLLQSFLTAVEKEAGTSLF